VVTLAQDGVILLPRWSITDRNCRQLRRKLRAARQAGLRIERGGDRLPITEMARIAAEWARQNRGEHGFSMGRFSVDLLAHQEVFLGWQDSRLVGFVTCHPGRAEWSLDLMRHGSDAPSGTMHALVHAAIMAAQQSGTVRMSLAARPNPPRLFAPLVSRLAAMRGLAQFKQSFAPQWRPLYLAAPGWFGLVAGLIRVTLAIHRPALCARMTATAAPGPALANPYGAHVKDAEIEFESLTQPCDARDQILARAGLTDAVTARLSSGQTHDRRPFPPP